ADKPKFIVMMIGVNDRQAIRERAPVSAPTPARPNASAGKQGPGQPAPPLVDPELQAQQSADQQNAELQARQEPPVPAAPCQGRGGKANTGPFECHTEKG